MKRLKLLECALTRLTRGWCQNTWAVDAQGGSAYFGSREAARWCSLGAMRACQEEAGESDYVPDDAKQVLATVIKGSYTDEEIHPDHRSDQSPADTIVLFNDNSSRTQEQVLDVFRRAVEMARGDAPAQEASQS